MRVLADTVLPLDRRWYAREETRQRVGVAGATPSERTIGVRLISMPIRPLVPGPARLAPLAAWLAESSPGDRGLEADLSALRLSIEVGYGGADQPTRSFCRDPRFASRRNGVGRPALPRSSQPNVQRPGPVLVHVLSNSSCYRVPVGRSGLCLVSRIASGALSTASRPVLNGASFGDLMGTSGKRARDDRLADAEARSSGQPSTRCPCGRHGASSSNSGGSRHRLSKLRRQPRS